MSGNCDTAACVCLAIVTDTAAYVRVCLRIVTKCAYYSDGEDALSMLAALQPAPDRGAGLQRLLIG